MVVNWSRWARKRVCRGRASAPWCFWMKLSQAGRGRGVLAGWSLAGRVVQVGL